MSSPCTLLSSNASASTSSCIELRMNSKPRTGPFTGAAIRLPSNFNTLALPAYRNSDKVVWWQWPGILDNKPSRLLVSEGIYRGLECGNTRLIDQERCIQHHQVSVRCIHAHINRQWLQLIQDRRCILVALRVN